MTQWRILDFQKFSGAIEAKDGHVNAAGRSVALADVSCILVGVNCSTHASLFASAASYGVPILHCDWRGVPTSVSWPWSTNTRVGARHISQSNLSEGRRKNAWMQIVRAKIMGQASNLLEGSRPRLQIERLAREVRSGDPMNNEAQAARIYWPNVFSSTSNFSRDREDNHGYNAMLNYGYTVLRGHTIRLIVASGLWPTLGIWHHNRANVFALADDLIEPFRPVVDRVIQGIPENMSLRDADVRRELVSASEKTFLQDGSKTVAAIERLCQEFAQYVEGDREKLAVKFWQG
jgi:CRISPR-associated protein Cas1